MGQRSQIYIRYNVNYVSGAATPNPKTSDYSHRQACGVLTAKFSL